MGRIPGIALCLGRDWNVVGLRGSILELLLHLFFRPHRPRGKLYRLFDDIDRLQRRINSSSAFDGICRRSIRGTPECNDSSSPPELTIRVRLDRGELGKCDVCIRDLLWILRWGLSMSLPNNSHQFKFGFEQKRRTTGYGIVCD